MCFDDGAHPPIPLSENSGAHGESIRLSADDGAQVAAYLAEPGDPGHAQVVILPDVRGLHHFYEELALRFADVGMRALAIDYFSRTAESDERNGSFEFMPHVEKMTTDTFGQDLAAAVTHIRQEAGRDLATFTVGFCMGGSLSFWAGTRALRLDGVVGFYAGLTRSRGAVTPVVDFASRIECPVLGLFGGDDPGIPQADIDRFDWALSAGNVPHEVVVYPGAPHSFFDRRATDYASASADAWSRIQGFIAGHEAVRV